MNILKSCKNKGFSLLELSIVLLISGLIMSAIIGIIPVFYKVSKQKLDVNKLEKIENAFEAYVLKNHKLPYPADITLTLSDNIGSIGKETTNLNKLRVISDGNILIGTVPAVSLGLAPEYVADAYGNKLVYIVNIGCLTNIYDCSDDENNLISINFGADNIINDAIFAIISNGFNRKGAYGLNSKTASETTNISSAELANTYDNISNTIHYTGASRLFDDNVIYSIKSGMIKDLNLGNLDCVLDWLYINDNKNEYCNSNSVNFSDTSLEKLPYKHKIISDLYETNDQFEAKCVIECTSLGNISIYYEIMPTEILSNKSVGNSKNVANFTVSNTNNIGFNNINYDNFNNDFKSNNGNHNGRSYSVNSRNSCHYLKKSKKIKIRYSYKSNSSHKIS